MDTSPSENAELKAEVIQLVPPVPDNLADWTGVGVNVIGIIGGVAGGISFFLTLSSRRSEKKRRVLQARENSFRLKVEPSRQKVLSHLAVMRGKVLSYRNLPLADRSVSVTALLNERFPDYYEDFHQLRANHIDWANNSELDIFPDDAQEKLVDDIFYWSESLGESEISEDPQILAKKIDGLCQSMECAMSLLKQYEKSCCG